MALKIRLRQQGKKNYSVFRLVLTDVRTRRDGKYVEALGWYNPHRENDEEKASFDTAKINEWLTKGAEPSEKALLLIRRFCPEVAKSYSDRSLQKGKKRRLAAKSRRS